MIIHGGNDQSFGAEKKGRSFIFYLGNRWALTSTNLKYLPTLRFALAMLS